MYKVRMLKNTVKHLLQEKSIFVKNKELETSPMAYGWYVRNKCLYAVYIRV